jgi:hypothetical protein
MSDRWQCDVSEALGRMGARLGCGWRRLVEQRESRDGCLGDGEGRGGGGETSQSVRVQGTAVATGRERPREGAVFDGCVAWLGPSSWVAVAETLCVSWIVSCGGWHVRLA